MRVYKESKTGRWYVDYYFGGARVRYPGGDSKRDADQLGSRITLEINAGEHDPIRTKRAVRGIDGASMSFEVAVEMFLQEYMPRGGTIRFYEERADVWLEFFSGRPISSITGSDVATMVLARQREVSDSTARKDLVSLGTFFKWARRKGLVILNPADAETVKRPPESFDPQHVHWLTDDELARLKSGSEPWLRSVIAWATETGMDKGAIRCLRWQSLDLARDERRIVAGRFAMQRGKTGKPVRQALTAGAVEALNRARRVRHLSSTVFLDAEGHPIEEKALDWALKQAYLAADIEGCNFRTFRHTFATRALRRGVPREVVARMMGHSTAFITERYMHVADDQLEAAARVMSGPERLSGSIVAVTETNESESEASE